MSGTEQVLDRVSVKGLQRSPSLGCGAVAEVALFRAVSLLPGILHAIESVLQQMLGEGRREEGEEFAHTSPCFHPGPTATCHLPKGLCLSYRGEAQEAAGI